ncbi:uncharacterized protein LOC112350168 isoform X2 [Selaginella moellendorffii]|nr:uncharacterized protein LOC112349782 isoform X2 [Selaginella moellendorffii]XP_024540639.1 uncharacterized protein LOC112349782 isoform X2 [Selaginella moellendorffii]XP_024541680.1 uncharacterized protein LOC112350168 isoform X2 [Selaginella moellendorffii]XP_024541681.1 uncharacterized protein LOC112350168 isoform X2 [Selaginella moellendorffii]|eukprot:XP_024540638.1 uncharacterized protein LOC112349782 isoform X2 [Selaginella moellendorffii]
MAGQSKRREKYARREDAIVDAIELEKEQIEQLKTAYVGTGGKKSKLKGKQKSVDGGGDQPKKGNGDTSGVNRKVSKKKAQTAKDRETSDLEDGAALLPRMRGLQDLVSAGTSSKITTVEGLDGSSEVEAPPLDESMQQTVPDQVKALKRKRSSGRAEEAPSKRRDRKRPILQVLETLERDNENQDDPAVKAEGVCEGEDKLSDECESTQETLQLVSSAQDKPAAHFLDAHSASYNSKDVAVVACEGTTLPSHTSASPTGITQEEKPPVKKEKGSKKKASMPPRTLASLVVDSAGDVQKVTKQRKGEPNSSQPTASVSRFDVGTASACRSGKGKLKVEAEDTVTACCPSDDQKENWKEGFVHPRTRYEKQPVPVVSLSSTITGKTVCGYPVSVEVVEGILGTRKKRLKNYSGELATSPKPWQTAKRTARQRTPRSEILATSDDDYTTKVPGTGKKRSKEALSKKLLKKAVLASKKIRTLASISEEKRRQPENGFGFLSSKAPPKWPVATLVPVSVALNRLRGVVCS